VNDDELIYDDTRYFRRGRAGFRPDPTPKVNRIDLIVCACAIAVVIGVFIWAHFALPTIGTVMVNAPVMQPLDWSALP